MNQVIGTRTTTVVKITGSRSGVGKIIHTSPKKRCGVTTWCQFTHLETSKSATGWLQWASTDSTLFVMRQMAEELRLVNH
uniref:Uncharacterized protein n=1 Tax=viral metagenome TaxID=1070528 RepID=A0A6M3JHK9_9ZZZZ